jgi:hypothetical protein
MDNNNNDDNRRQELEERRRRLLLEREKILNNPLPLDSSLQEKADRRKAQLRIRHRLEDIRRALLPTEALRRSNVERQHTWRLNQEQQLVVMDPNNNNNEPPGIPTLTAPVSPLLSFSAGNVQDNTENT